MTTKIMLSDQNWSSVIETDNTTVVKGQASSEKITIRLPFQRNLICSSTVLNNAKMSSVFVRHFSFPKYKQLRVLSMILSALHFVRGCIHKTAPVCSFQHLAKNVSSF